MPSPEVLEALKTDQAAGLTHRQLAAKHNVPFGSIARWLKPPVIQTLSESVNQAIQVESSEPASENTESPKGTESTSLPPSTPFVQPTASLTQLEEDREAARQAMRAGIAGKWPDGRKCELSTQQTALIKLLLKDELEPEAERNLYAGRSTDELAERSLVLAVSVLGLRKVAELLRTLGKAGTLDLGLEWSPDGAMGEAAVERVESVAPAEAVALVSAVPVETAPRVHDSGVESLGP